MVCFFGYLNIFFANFLFLTFCTDVVDVSNISEKSSSASIGFPSVCTIQNSARISTCETFKKVNSAIQTICESWCICFCSLLKTMDENEREIQKARELGVKFPIRCR